MPFLRSSGILLHPTSLPGRYGIGDLGPAAHGFADFLRAGGQRLWQVLPLGPTGYGNSPYLTYSALAGNPMLISPDLLLRDGLLQNMDLAQVPAFPEERVDFTRVSELKRVLLEAACQRLQSHPAHKASFATFCHEHKDWLDDYGLFMAIKEAHQGKPWCDWPGALARRDTTALRAAHRKLGRQVDYHRFTQYLFTAQWNELRSHLDAAGVRLLGDVAFYTAHDSVDVWSEPEAFCLDPETGRAAQMAGVPPDYFSATGQLWGNPVYSWSHHQHTGFTWWIRRLRQLLQLVDIVRVDHFRGFEAFWQVPMGAPTAETGEWVKSPGRELFSALRAALGELPIIAEDLGIITPEVNALRAALGFPGMKVLQFAFDGNSRNPYLPHWYEANAVVYTGTHDNDTTQGWWAGLGPKERRYVSAYAGMSTHDSVSWSLIRLAMSSVANQAIFPMQDVLGLGGPARMNMPGETAGNWAWRLGARGLSRELAGRLAYLADLYGRTLPPELPQPVADTETHEISSSEQDSIRGSSPMPRSLGE
ncbi:MAG: 4-alpha-glucanotransferase [Candidatus Schekmanbacteria bacterium]|nr:4-alpha-glucanotransferase [Candidatus Schekmanbacteria bacterium]